MKILVACEYSARVRDAFRKLGHDAWSCDLLECEGDPTYHIQGDVLNILNDGWDIMIGHPPCQYISFAGIGYFNKEKYGDKAVLREQKRDEAIKFFMALWNAPIEKICLENPRGFIMQTLKPSQIIHPYYFGDAEKKTTCLWLKNLPLLTYDKTDSLFNRRTATDVPQPTYFDKSGKPRFFSDAISGLSKDAWKERSRIFQGIANAMADQWGML